MCPQPQKPIDHDQEVLKILSLLPRESVREICVSGGEPTVNANFTNVMKTLAKFPNLDPMVLTNGRRFSDFEFTKNVIANAPFNTQFLCIRLFPKSMILLSVLKELLEKPSWDYII